MVFAFFVSPLVFEIEIHKVKKGGKPVAEARELLAKAIKTDTDL